MHGFSWLIKKWAGASVLFPAKDLVSCDAGSFIEVFVSWVYWAEEDRGSLFNDGGPDGAGFLSWSSEGKNSPTGWQLIIDVDAFLLTAVIE